MLNPNDLEKAKLVQLGLQQFESLHFPEKTTDDNQHEVIICSQCGTDFPCDRMLLFMLMQTIMSLQAMMPSGNMGALMKRFSNG